MMLVEEADVAGAVCSLGWIKEKTKRENCISLVVSDVQSLPLLMCKNTKMGGLGECNKQG